MTEIRLGMIGCGQISKRFFDQAEKLPGVRFVATCAAHEESARSKAAERGCDRDEPVAAGFRTARLQRRICPHRLSGRVAMVSLRHRRREPSRSRDLFRPSHRGASLLHCRQAGLGHLSAARRFRGDADHRLQQHDRLPSDRRRRALGATGTAGRGQPAVARFPAANKRHVRQSRCADAALDECRNTISC